MKHHLEALRASHQTCVVAAFGDAATQIILRASHEKTYRREHLDLLCAQAATCFGMMDAVVQTWPCDQRRNASMVLGQDTVTLFVRQDPTASEFLCLVCKRPDAIDALFADAHHTLAVIGDAS